MKIAAINILHNGSTGKIMLQAAELSRRHGHEVRTFSPIIYHRGRKEVFPEIPGHFYWGNRLDSFIHYYMGVLFGANGLFSIMSTRKLLKELRQFSPDVIHLHNLHAFCINLPMLFGYIKKHHIRVVWTLHDCWSFTGHCPYFTIEKCDKWESCCHHCPQPQVYPKMILDTSRLMHRLKKKWFCGLEDMTIVTPSLWLAGLAKRSYLKEYPICVINNGIDLTVFKPAAGDFRHKYGISEDKFVLLGVAFDWGYRKGLDVFIELAKRLDGDKYQIVLVGTDDAADSQLPENIISIHRTNNQQELAEIYAAADLFVNPTREENYPTVNLEALACGTPVLTFRTGGSPEALDESCGAVVDCDDVDAMEKEIKRICAEKPFSADSCVSKAQSFDKKARFEEYVKLYESVKP